MYLYIYLSLNIWMLFMSINIWMHIHVYKYIYLRRPLLSRVTGKMTKMLTYADVYIYNRIYIYMHICAGHYYRTWQGRWGRDERAQRKGGRVSCWFGKIAYRQHTSQHTSAYVSTRQQASADELAADSVRLHIVSIRQHKSADVSRGFSCWFGKISYRQHTSAYVSIRQQTS
jgi:hypothetical protein